MIVYLSQIHCPVYLLGGTTSTCSCKNKIVNGRDLMRIKSDWGTRTHGRPKVQGEKEYMK